MKLNPEQRIAIAAGWLRQNPRTSWEREDNPTLPLLREKFGLEPLEAIAAIRRSKMNRKPRHYGHWNAPNL